MRRAYKDKFFVSGHFWTLLGGADSQKLDDEQVQLKDKLPDVLILPDTLINVLGQLTDLDNVGRFVSYQLLQVLLHSEWSLHL